MTFHDISYNVAMISGVYFEPNRGYCAFSSLFYPRIFEHRNIFSNKSCMSEIN